MITQHQKTRLLRAIAADRGGSAAVEFALVAPLLLMFMMGMSDALFNTYANSILEGAVQKAARDATLQGNNSATTNAALDARVLQLINGLAPTATASSTRRSYPNFGSVATQEPFTDGNGDGDRDPGECYTDINNNGQWDIDPGVNGDGGASDAILYTMTVTYPRSFPAYALLGGNRNISITSSTILKNQPWADQSVPVAVTRCA